MINVKMQPSQPKAPAGGHPPVQTHNLSPKIAVIGVGGAGGNAVNNMIASGLEGCDFIVCNTDAQALGHSLCQDTIQLGAAVTAGLGAGSKPEVGRAAAEESLEDVMRFLDGANMAFVTAGMGGGTGTGAAPVIAKACRERGILTIGVVTKPFHFEGMHRMNLAESGIEEMQHYVDTLIVIPNQNLFRVANEKTTFAEAFKMADSVLQSGVRGVTDLMVRPGLVNLDFADIRTAMLEMGKAMMGTGEASGEKRAIEAAEAAINNPLLDDVTMKGARGVIINVTGGFDMTLFEADEASNRIRDEVDPNANIIFGATFDESLEGVMRVSVVATGIEREAIQKTAPSPGGGGGGISPSVINKRTLESSGGVTSAPAGLVNPTLPGSAMASDRRYKTGAENVRGITAPVLPSKTPEVPAAKAEAPVAPKPTPAQEVSSMSAPLRGSRHNGAFIPPQPAMPDQVQPSMGMPSPQAMAPAPVAVPARAPVDAEVQQPLDLGAPREAPREAKKPGFFERITDAIQSQAAKYEGSHQGRLYPAHSPVSQPSPR